MTVKQKAFVAAAVFIPFTAYSFWVVGTEGYFGFIELALRERWSLQVTLDLVIALVAWTGYLHGDMRARGLPFWPLLLGTVLLGSIAPLAYVALRPRWPKQEAELQPNQAKAAA
ncbi:MAG: hypothetical protein AAFX94_08380 [Myxococcota bacterium]